MTAPPSVSDPIAAACRAQEALFAHVSVGLLLVDVEGRLQPAASACVERWFGPVPVGTSFVDYLLPDTPDLAARVQLALLQLELLPFVVIADQLGVRFWRGTVPYDLAVDPIEQGGRVTGMVLRVTDASERVRRERAARESRELVGIVRHLVRNESALRAALRDLERCVTGLPITSVEDLPTRLHTAKGQAAMLGLELLTDRLHQMESSLAAGALPDDARRRGLDELMKVWAGTKELIITVVPDEGRVAVAQVDLRRVLTELSQGKHAEALGHIRSWTSATVGDRLQPLTKLAEEAAHEMGKRVRLIVEEDQLHLPYPYVDALVGATGHLVRNAVAHGIEDPGVRAAADKDPVGTVRVAAWRHMGRIGLTVSDDGQGLKWDEVSAVAKRRGLPHDGHHDLVRALFAAGLSTQERVNMVAGRGQGLAAVWELLRPIHGTIECHNEPGQGTTWRVSARAPSAEPVTAEGR